MKEMNNILVICAGFPTPTDPTTLPFIDQLVCSWADMGISISVICPVVRFIEFKDKTKFYKTKWTRITNFKNQFIVYHPRFVGFGALEEKYSFIYNIGYRNFQKAILKTIKHIKDKPDVVYSHFLTSGKHAGDLSEIFRIPGFCAFGESSLWSVNSFNYEKSKKSIWKLKGIISVSSENKKILIQSGLYPEERIYIVPNAVDTNIFYQRNKEEMRKKYSIPEKGVIGIFVGSFCDRKGVMRVQEAAQQCGIQMIYLGDGEEHPRGDNVLFSGKVSHELIPEYLSAADFFVLPTKAEGCCNSIIEAMACGLPIISSNLSFNDDILCDEYSIRIDPNDIDQIKKAILEMALNTSKREKMSKASIIASKNFRLDVRAKKIIDYMSNTSF